ncbi:vWA domain-containing protein [Anaerophilus nitritogenes]|uniref:vWA domain-containing protein n=1 Tax=Anaerophilus nitritogenes TaxID=2498136 RepID=UPI00101C04C2|nr:vWA domain-containing protein [Anaerophilus nitritogenes]
MNKICKGVCVLLIFILIQPGTVLAKEVMYTPSCVDVMFVLDSSYSMNANDQNKMAIGMMNMFIDALPSKKVKVGYVAYDHSINSSLKPMPIETSKQRSTIKKAISNIKKSGYSDIGLGLKKGFELLTSNKDQNTQPIIILISDGENELPRNSNRTVNDSSKDVNDVIHQSKEKGIPIYTVTLGNEFESASILTKISHETNAQFYTHPTSNDLIEIFSEIIKKHIMATVKPIAATMSTGEKQSITIPIKDQWSREVNILLVASEPIQYPKLIYSGDNVSFSKSNHFFCAKILNPDKQDMTLEFIGKKNDTIKSYLLSDYDISLILDTPDTIYKNKPFRISAYFKNNMDNEQIKDPVFYQKITPNIVLMDNNNKISISPNVLKDKIQMDSSIQNSGEYILNAIFTHEDFNMQFNDLIFHVKNHPPQSEFFDEIKIPFICKTKTYALDKYFKDPDGDLLTYEIVNSDMDLHNLNINNSTLTIHPSKIGKYTFSIKVMDNEGKSFQTKPITLWVMSTLQYYYPITITIICLLIGCIVGFIIYRKKNGPQKTFTGKLDGYFLHLQDEEEIPPLNFPLYQFENKKRISLEELLLYSKIEKPFLKASQIYFEKGFDKTIIFYHESQATIMIGTKIVPQKVRCILEYKTKMYITFEDGVSEMEIHYNQFKPSVSIIGDC